jgi:hypothetical protein
MLADHAGAGLNTLDILVLVSGAVVVLLVLALAAQDTVTVDNGIVAVVSERLLSLVHVGQLSDDFQLSGSLSAAVLTDLILMALSEVSSRGLGLGGVNDPLVVDVDLSLQVALGIGRATLNCRYT